MNNNTTYKTIKKIRGDWGAINPVTKIIPNKKKDYINESYFDEYYSMDDCCHDLALKRELYDDFDWDYDCD